MTSPPEHLVGRVLDNRYRLDRRIGAGGMGEVYRGRHLMMDQRVAIKVFRPVAGEQPNAAKRFAREAKSTFRLDHPNCVRVTDLGVTDDNLLYLVMEYLDGRTISRELSLDGPLSSDRVIHIAQQMCGALDCAHAMGLIHRDLKPDNVMLVQRGSDPDVVKVLDFGLAKLVSEPGTGFETAMSLTPLTRQGMVFGTPEYMSPEQAMDESLTPASDLYALGVVMYEMLTGSVPFVSAQYMEILAAHVREPVIAPIDKRPDLVIDRELNALVLSLLSKTSAHRPQTAVEVADALAALHRSPSRPWSRISDQVAASATIDLDRDTILGATETQTSDDGVRPPVSQTQMMPATRRSRRGYWVTAAVVLGCAGILWWSLRGAADSRDADATAVAPTTTHTTSVSSAVGNVGRVPAGPTDAGITDARSPDVRRAADAAFRSKRPTRPGKARTDKRVRVHLDAARKAQQAGNLLEQMAHADSALQIDNDNVHAAYLLGDALLTSDKHRACRYLRRARRLAKARKTYDSAQCKRTD